MEEYRALTGLVMDEITGKLRVKRGFHDDIVEKYKEGLSQLLEEQRKCRDSRKGRSLGSLIAQAGQRIECYGKLMDLYRADSEQCFTEGHGVLGISTGKYTYLKNTNLAFLTIFLEEKQAVEKALAVLKKAMDLENITADYGPYVSEALKRSQQFVTGDLNPSKLQIILDEWRKDRSTKSSGGQAEPMPPSGTVEGEIEEEFIKVDGGKDEKEEKN